MKDEIKGAWKTKKKLLRVQDEMRVLSLGENTNTIIPYNYWLLYLW